MCAPLSAMGMGLRRETINEGRAGCSYLTGFRAIRKKERKWVQGGFEAEVLITARRG